MKISVAMATYNGARFIREQLDSIAAQIFKPCELQVGDDGSSDDTIGIIRDFARTTSFPVGVHLNDSNLGYAQNFIETVKRCSGDWIALCDQDDVWFPEKLEVLRQAAETASDDTNLIVHSVLITDDELRPSGRTWPIQPRNGVFKSLTRSLMWEHLGAAQLIRDRLVQGIDHEHRAPTHLTNVDPFPHDWWFALLGNVLGSTRELRRPLAFYRRYNESVSQTGKSKNKKTFKAILATGSNRYLHMQAATAGIANALRHQARHVRDEIWMSNLLCGASRFDALSDAFGHRGKLYSRDHRSQRLFELGDLLRKPGYFRMGADSFGLRALLKDLVIGVAGRSESSSQTPAQAPWLQ